MEKKIIISKKNSDGSYDTGEYLFEGVDLYHGDMVSRRLEIAPAGSPVNNVKLKLVCTRNNIEYDFLPDEEGYNLICDRYPNMKIHFTDLNGIKYKADKNGILSIIKTLSSPLDLIVILEAKAYTVNKINKSVLLDDISMIVYSM